MDIFIPEAVKRLAAAAGTPIYLVGGCVRNAYGKLGDTDVDLCGPLIATALNLPRGARVKIVNYRLGTALISFMGGNFEYTPFRLEKYAEGGSHTPAEIKFTTSLEADAIRRDFTVNSIYVNAATGEVKDPVGGIADIERKVLRSYNPERTFSSDGLRLMRLARLAAETGYKIDAATARAAIASAENLKDITGERKREELDKILNADTKYGVADAHYRGMKLLVRLGLLPYVVEPLAGAEEIPQNPEYHAYDVLEHTLRTVKAAPSGIVRLAALMHDCGKPYSYNMYGNMHGHEKASAVITRDVLGQRCLRYPKEVVERVAQLVEHHMYDRDGKTKEGKLRMFVAEHYDIIDELAALMRADKLGTGKFKEEELPASRIVAVRDKMLEEGAPTSLGDLEVSGADITDMGFSGPAVGEILSELFRECVLCPKLNNREWLLSYAQKRLK
ncbi:MAG: HD domain-containing protein [Clostridia bacterium]|nr:HD domain-containing protein [Clostridia bacterium]